MKPWHVDEDLARRYADGQVGMALAASVDVHVISCAECRQTVAGTVPDERLSGIWDAITGEIDAPRPRLVERILTRLGMAEDTARLVVTTPSLRLGWLASVGLMLAFASIAAEYGDRGRLLFLTLAPLLPVVGVAAAFAAPVDITRPFVAPTPYSKFRLLLIRSLAVLATSIALSALSGLTLLDDGYLAVAWLLPAFALTTVTLALSSRFDPAYAGGAVVVAWLAVTWGRATWHHVSLAAFAPAAQAVYLLVTLAALVVIMSRRAAFDYDRRWP
jgi:hypothetical protein